MSDEALYCIALERQARTGRLDLSRLDLASLPAELATLSWLTQLKIAGNPIADLSPLQHLSALQTLYCGGTNSPRCCPCCP